jgi:alkylation response protein AidB-like acyl-CoA dehydrogenase
MDLRDRLNPVLDAAATSAPKVDAEGRFPSDAVSELRASGLLGLTLPTEAGGLGAGPHEFVEAVSAIAEACGSTAMIYLMHSAAAMTVAAAPPPGSPDLLSSLASGKSLGTLAFSEPGSRSHFWAPVSKAATAAEGMVRLDARKSWVTSAGYADVYVVSTGSAEQDGVDLYAVPADSPGVAVTGDWQGMGLRGNASNPMSFTSEIDEGQRVGAIGGGFDLMMQAVLPWFNLGNASVSVGLSRAAATAAVRHTSGTELEHLSQSLAALPTIRAQLARMSLEVDSTAAYVEKTAAKLVEPADDTMLHVLGVKALANDAALRVTDTAMRVCGGAAFSAHLQIDRMFRDARAGSVMAPTADVLYDFYGKAITGQPLF